MLFMFRSFFSFFLLSLFFLNSPVFSSSETQITDLYRQQKFDQIINLFSPLSLEQHNQDSLYYLALSYAHKKQNTKAQQLFTELAQRDPSFFKYRMEYDLDLSAFVQKNKWTINISSSDRILGRQASVGHQLVGSEKGVFLYRNGLKQKISDHQEVLKAGFIGEDQVYLLVKEPRHTRLIVYSGKRRQIFFEKTLPVKLTQVSIVSLNHRYLIHTLSGFALFDKQGILRRPWTEAESVRVDRKERLVHYLVRDGRKKEKKEKVVSF